ncbi:MAG: EF-hand domain-containing protein, partial [Phycisphaerales bacterium]|nr:EF-hand domain-containing protein [Phycisphaerales bacterium]
MIETTLLLVMLGPMQTAPTDRYTARFVQLDRNHDGVVTPDELPRPRIFNRLDLDGDGRITWIEGLGAAGATQRIFVTTMGASQDWSSEDLRRLLANAALWQLGEEDAIPPQGLNAPIIGDWSPS